MLLKTSRTYLIFAIYLFTFCLTLSAQQKQYIIQGISVEGNQYADPQTIISLSGLKPGDQITIPNDNKIHNAIKTLWTRKQFSDVSINVDKITTLGVFLVIKVKEFPRLKDIIIENNKELSLDDAKKAIGKVRGDILSGYEAYLSSKKLKNKYKEEGLIFAEVDPKISNTDSANYANLRLKIEEGKEFHVTSISFVGNDHLNASDLAGSFDKTKTKSWWQFWRSSKFDLMDYDKDKELLLAYYKKNGFKDAEIVKDSLSYNQAEGLVDIKIWVREGSRLFVRNIEFTGNTSYPSDLLIKRLEFKKGDPYNSEKFQLNLNGNQDQTDAKSVYLDNGFLYTDFQLEETRVLPDSIDLQVKVTEGSRVTIRKINIVGNTKTKDKVIRRELYTRPGDFFNRSAIIRSVRALGMLNYFNPEGLRPNVEVVDKTKVDIVYKVEERSTDTFNASVGFAGSFGLTGSIGFSFNNFSFAEPFHGGAGQAFNLNWEFGQASRYQNFSIGFTEPWLFDEPTTAGFNIFDSNINLDLYKLRRTGIQVNLGRRFRWPDDYFRGDVSARLQRNDVGTSGGTYYRQGISTEAAIGFTISRLNLDNMYFPTEGSKFIFSNEFAMGALGIGNMDFLKTSLKFEVNQPVLQIKGINRMVWALGSYQGYIAGFKSDTMMNPIELYYMGGNGLSNVGVQPFRGYPDQSIGPQKGGKVLSYYYTELRFGLSLDPMPIYLYTFAEAGNVWQDLKSTDPFNLKRSAGFGLKLLLNPIGLIGFSYGYGFDKIDATGEISGWRFLFHLGQ